VRRPAGALVAERLPSRVNQAGRVCVCAGMASRSRFLVLIAAMLLAVSGCRASSGAQAGTTAPATSGASASTAPPASPGATGAASGLTTSPGPAATAGSTGSGLPAGGPVPVDFRAWSVTWVSDQVGYLLGSGRCSRPPCTSVVRTTDGGRHWIGVPAPVAPLPAATGMARSVRPDTVRDLRFATPTDGYAFGGGLWTTHDGARTWRKLNLGAVSDLATDGRTVYAIVSDCGSGQPECGALRLLASPVGHDAFRPTGRASGASTGPAGGPAVVSTGTGLVVAELGKKIFVSTAAGQWQQATNPCEVTLAGVLAAATGGAVQAFCAEGAAGSLYVTVARSTDRGRSWTRPSAPARIHNGLVTLTAGSASLVAIAATSPDLGGNLLVSRDGGAHWASQTLTRGEGYLYVGARSASSLVVLAGPPTGAIWTTSTAGRSWNRLPIR
jgi:photosystem II stability/assembly factor-like uncharacterized protein